MNRPSQWLFETPFVSELTEQFNYNNFELMVDRETPTPVLRSLRFRSDSRLQAAANNRPPMRQGERGRAVQTLQKALIDLGFPMPISTQRRGSPDGIYGSETTATVRKFQQKYGLKVDGVIGKNTMSWLDRLFISAPPINQEPMCGVPQGKFQASRRQRSRNQSKKMLGLLFLNLSYVFSKILLRQSTSLMGQKIGLKKFKQSLTQLLLIVKEKLDLPLITLGMTSLKLSRMQIFV